MSRPPLPVGQHGNISYRALGPKKVQATVRVCDADGQVRVVTRQGTSRQAALSRLQAALKDRPGAVGVTLTEESKLAEAAEEWFAELDRMVVDGMRAPNTARLYRLSWGKHVEPALGNRRLRECKTPALSGLLVALREHGLGPDAVRTVRAVLSGVLGYARRHGAINDDPMRGVARISKGSQKVPRALTEAERKKWIDKMTADEVSVSHDLPALTRLLLATGCRIGEALAVAFEEFDRSSGTVRIEWTIARVKGRGLVRVPTKTAAGKRTLRLPGWAVTMLANRGDVLGWSGPVFPAIVSRRGGYRRVGGGWRDPSNVSRQWRAGAARAGFGWVTSHVFRKTVATILDEAGLTAREIADQLGHARVAITQDVYMGRKASNTGAAVTLEGVLSSEDNLPGGAS